MSRPANASVSVSKITRDMMMSLGWRVGRLEVQGMNRNEDVVCVCDCGETIAVDQSEWLTGKIYQCESCTEWENASPVQRIIGCQDTYEALMDRARGARDRCENPDNESYGDYGGRGIRFMFEDEEHYALTLWSLGWRYGDERTTDRIDVNGHYEPENVRLATASEQTRNRRVSVFVDTGDETVSLADLAEQHGISPSSPEYSRLSSFVSKTKQRAFNDVMNMVEQLADHSEAA